MNNIIHLRNWSFHTLEDKLMLSGIADEHPRYGKNVELLNTSSVISIEEDEKPFVLICRTLNSIYKVDWRLVNLDASKSLCEPSALSCSEAVRNVYITYLKLVRAKDEDFEQLNSHLQSYIKVITEGRKTLKEYEENLNKELISNAKKYTECIYMNVSSIYMGNNIAYNIGGKVGVIQPEKNDMPYKNTVKYKTAENSDVNVQLEYFIGRDAMSISILSENIQNVVIHSNKRNDVVVNGRTKVRFDETVVLGRNEILG